MDVDWCLDEKWAFHDGIVDVKVSPWVMCDVVELMGLTGVNMESVGVHKLRFTLLG